MGRVAVLHPQDVLKDPKAMKYPWRSPNVTPKSIRNPNPKPTLLKPSNRRKRSPQKKKDRSGTFTSPPKTHLQMGQVKILKRGEALIDPTTAQSFQKENSPVKKKDDEKKENSLLKKKVETQRFAGHTTSFQKENGPVMNKDENQRFSGDTTMFQKENSPVMKKKKKKDDNQRLGAGDLLAAARQIRLVDFYAGSAFISSPSPSSLPVPAFFKKNGGGSAVTETNNNNNSEATSDLLRLLNLNL